MADRGIIDIANTDSNGNVGVTVRLTDTNGTLLENIKITGEDTDNSFTEAPIIGTPNTSNSLTAYKSGKTCILKAINLETRVGYDGYGTKNGFYNMATLPATDQYKNLFTPKTNQWWYNEITLLQSLTIKANKKNDNGTYTETEQLINNPYYMSFGLDTNGILYNRLERKLTTNSLVNGVNFTLVYLV